MAGVTSASLHLNTIPEHTSQLRIDDAMLQAKLAKLAKVASLRFGKTREADILLDALQLGRLLELPFRTLLWPCPMV